jgi:TM2 domain-containing membrane protein YozV
MEEPVCYKKLQSIQIRAVIKGIIAVNSLICMLSLFCIIFAFSSPSYGLELGLKTGSAKGISKVLNSYRAKGSLWGPLIAEPD